MSKIEWTDLTWNPVTGCSWISPGCDNCYAKPMANRLKHNQKIGDKYRNGFEVTWHPEELERDFGKKPKKIFVCSMGDLFHRKTPMIFIDRVFDVIRNNPQHIFQILTKRPENALEFQDRILTSWPDNVWFGVTAENREQSLERISYLYEIKSKVKFVSFEPLLEDLSFDPLYVDWVIVGGETGQRARYMDPDWARKIKLTCGVAGIPFFFKQMSEKREIPADLNIKEFPE